MRFETQTGRIEYTVCGKDLILIRRYCYDGDEASESSALGDFCARHRTGWIAMEAKSPRKQRLARQAGFDQSPYIATLFERKGRV